MRDSEIREYANPFRVLQRIREKQNQELVRLTLVVPLIEGLEQRLQLLLQQRKQLDISYRIKCKFIYKNFIIFDFICC